MSPSPTTPAPATGQQALAEALQSSARLLRGLMILLFIGYLGSGVFVVQQHQQAFVLVLGKIRATGEHRVKEAGLHWTWPRPFAEVVRVPAKRVQTVETNRFWTGGEEGPAVRSMGPLTPGLDGYVLTGDANIVHTRWSLRYVIDAPEVYYFGIEDPAAFTRSVLDEAVLGAMAFTPVDAALRTGQSALRDEVERRVRDVLADTSYGISVQSVELVGAMPPGQTLEAFNSVVGSELNRSRIISEARAAATSAGNEAAAEADQRRAEAESEARALYRNVQADRDYFNKIRVQLGDRPEVLLASLRQQAMERALSQVKGRYVVSEGPGGEVRIKISPPPRNRLNPGDAP